jgi:hypothetical protein
LERLVVLFGLWFWYFSESGRGAVGLCWGVSERQVLVVGIWEGCWDW